jgi:hypothetical protein
MALHYSDNLARLVEWNEKAWDARFGTHFSKVLATVTLYSKYTRALTFKNLCEGGYGFQQHQGGRGGGGGGGGRGGGRGGGPGGRGGDRRDGDRGGRGGRGGYDRR